MRILIVSSQAVPAQFPPQVYGGVEAITASLAWQLAELGHEVHLMGPEGTDAGPKVQVHVGGTPGTLNPQEAMLQYMDNQAVMEVIKTADVIHCNTGTFAGYLPRRFAGIKTPVLHTAHGSTIRQPPDDLKGPLNLVAVSGPHRDELSKVWGHEMRMVHHGVSPEVYSYQEEKSERFLFLGRMTDYKGPLHAIDYAEKASVPIDIVGGSFGDKTRFVKQVKEACRVSKYARWVGKVSHTDKVKFLQRARALLIPTQGWSNLESGKWIEPFGLTAVEAAMCGTPVIGTPNGGFSENIKHGVSGFHCQTESEFAEAIKAVEGIAPNECRRWALENFSLVQMAHRYEGLYEEIQTGGW